MLKSITIAVAAFLSLWAAVAQDLILAENGKTNYQIIQGDNPSPLDKFAVQELQLFLGKATLSDFTKTNTKRIFLGNSVQVSNLLGKEKLKSLTSQEAWVVTQGDDLFLVGGGTHGNIYAVYTFLENQIGCRWLDAYGKTHIPVYSKLSIPSLDYREKPFFPNRFVHGTFKPYYNNPDSALFFFRNRQNLSQNNFADTPLPVGAVAEKLHGFQSHTLFFYITPTTEEKYNLLKWVWQKPQNYFTTHPEYFSLDKSGKRVVNMQLCFSNPELRKELTSRVEERIQADSSNGVYNLSALDWSGDFCYCPDCQNLKNKLQCTGAPLFDYLLELCKYLEPKYPEVKISTLAYRKEQSEKPPVMDGKLPGNLIIIFAPIYDNFSKTLNDSSNAETLVNLQNWTKLSSNVWVWYYTQPYECGYPPFGAVKRMAEDLQLMAKERVNGTFYEHASGVFEGINAPELTLWVMLKLFQNPHQDYRALVKEFCELYYGKAAAMMQQYLNQLDAELAQQKSFVHWNGPSTAFDYLTSRNLQAWQSSFDTMEQLVSNQPEYLSRVKETRMALDLATLGNQWNKFKKEYPDTSLTPEILRKRLWNTFESALKYRFLNEDPPNRYVAYLRRKLNPVIEEAFLVANVEFKPLPAPFDAIPLPRVHKAPPLGKNVIKMADGVYGIANYNPKGEVELPFTLGLYDQINKKHLLANKSIDQQDIIIDKFHLYKLGTSSISPQTLAWMSKTWEPNVQVGQFAEAGNPFKQFDIYMSLKFEGPAYSAKSKASKNQVFCDGIILIEVEAP
ncbi:MAG: DUF4838 domain-containing protein [Victivallaceae bacterium]|jgi:hypothetical protein